MRIWSGWPVRPSLATVRTMSGLTSRMWGMRASARSPGSTKVNEARARREPVSIQRPSSIQPHDATPSVPHDAASRRARRRRASSADRSWDPGSPASPPEAVLSTTAALAESRYGDAMGVYLVVGVRCHHENRVSPPHVRLRHFIRYESAGEHRVTSSADAPQAPTPAYVGFPVRHASAVNSYDLSLFSYP